MSASHQRLGRIAAVGAIVAGVGLGSAAVASAATHRPATLATEARERATSSDLGASRLERAKSSLSGLERSDALKAAVTADGRVDG